MAIKIKIGKSTPEPKIERKFELKIRKSLDGNLMIFDHADIDIVIMPSKNKVLALPKETMTDAAYGAQNRLFAHLKRKGVIDLSSIQGGNVYGSMEAIIAESFEEHIEPIKMVLLNVDTFITEERPYFDFVRSYVDEAEELLTDPDDLNSTELGDVAHSDTKGSIKPGYVRDPYGLSQLYKI
tara:strand:- start:744 stop:1289 length:546 start_codon:yes stop_codon:yes gene_type:complete